MVEGRSCRVRLLLAHAALIGFMALVAVPLALTAKTMTWANRGLQTAAGLFALFFGLSIMVEKAAALATGL
mgnify:CR=1 FL=1